MRSATHSTDCAAECVGAGCVLLLVLPGSVYVVCWQQCVCCAVWLLLPACESLETVAAAATAAAAAGVPAALCLSGLA